jgi:UDPglucose--hexose-1-phosphate uridylyltransferase
VLVDVLRRLDALWDRPMPYMLWIHQRPFDGASWPRAHLHVEIAVPQRGPGVPRYIAGGELGSGLYVNPVVPESAAAELRAVKW